MNKELIEKIIIYNYNEYGAEYGDALVDLKHENEWLHHIIKEVREYIENNSLYEQDYDYDYEENLYEYPPSDEQARKDILEILEGNEIDEKIK